MATRRPYDGAAPDAADGAVGGAADGGGGAADFSWRRVEARDAARARVGAAGRYVTDAFNQHAVGWCGCCYLVAATQCVEDRVNIARLRADPRAGRVQVPLQHVVDAYAERAAPAGWNACHGGVPLHVLQCFAAARCPLRLVRAPTPADAWRGFPRRVSACLRGDSGVRVYAARRLPPRVRALRAELLANGPVVLEVAAEALKRVDRATGVCTDVLTARPPNHAVCVVGWRTVGGVPCWIVRNSWGRRRAPAALPDDLACVRRGENLCEVRWEPWTGDPADPGFVYLPQSYSPLHEDAPSPWLAAAVALA